MAAVFCRLIVLCCQIIAPLLYTCTNPCRCIWISVETTQIEINNPVTARITTSGRRGQNINIHVIDNRPNAVYGGKDLCAPGISQVIQKSVTTYCEFTNPDPSSTTTSHTHSTIRDTTSIFNPERPDPTATTSTTMNTSATSDLSTSSDTEVVTTESRNPDPSSTTTSHTHSTIRDTTSIFNPERPDPTATTSTTMNTSATSDLSTSSDTEVVITESTNPDSSSTSRHVHRNITVVVTVTVVTTTIIVVVIIIILIMRRRRRSFNHPIQEIIVESLPSSPLYTPSLFSSISSSDSDIFNAPTAAAACTALASLDPLQQHTYGTEMTTFTDQRVTRSMTKKMKCDDKTV